MMNYKVRVENETESKEVQELFFELGYEFRGSGKVVIKSLLGHPHYMINIDSYLLFGMDGDQHRQELTIPQLRDKVVLHRNDVRDATHESSDKRKGYLTCDNVEYYFNFRAKCWDGFEVNSFESLELKPIQKGESVKEYLAKGINGSYILVENPVKSCSDWIEVPEGAEVAVYSDSAPNALEFWKNNGSEFFNGKKWFDCIKNGFYTFGMYENVYSDAVVVWQRNPPVEAEFNVEKAIAESELMVRENSKHSHYFKDVSELTSIDVYKVLQLFEVNDPCLQHIVKKALCAGQRGHKDFKKDIQDILDTAKRCVEIN